LFFSYRHELHYITAYNQFKDSKFIGHGLKSFRLLCDHPKYVPINKIINDNTIYSQFDGYFYLDNQYFIIKKNNTAPASLEDQDIIYKFSITGELKKFYIKNGEFVSKNQKIGYVYEYSNGCNTHPHNVHLQFLSELGLIGYFFLILAIIYIIIKLFVIFKNRITLKFVSLIDHSIFFCYLGIFVNLFPLFPSGNFFNNWLSVIFYFNIANLLSYLKFKN
jgi:O-antigen ligase